MASLSLSTARALVAAAFLMPVVALVVGSMREVGLPPQRTLELFPDSATLSNYARAFDVIPLARYAVNSAVVSAIVVPLAVVVASWVGFAIARLPREHARLIVAVAVAAYLVPGTALFVGRFWLFRSVGATDGLVPLIAPGILGVTPVFCLVYGWAFSRIPDELYDAARELGATPVGTWWRVGLPLVRSVTAVVAALAFAITWGSVFEPLVYVTDERWFTLPLGLRSLASLPQPDQPIMLAASVIAVVPVAVLFVLAQRWASGRAHE